VLVGHPAAVLGQPDDLGEKRPVTLCRSMRL
jgi:hypothetical protein